MALCCTCPCWRRGRTELQASMCPRWALSQVCRPDPIPPLLACRVLFIPCISFVNLGNIYFVFLFLGDNPDYLVTGTHAYPSGPGEYCAAEPSGPFYNNASLACVYVMLTVLRSCGWMVGVALTADTKIHRMPSEGGVHSMALALPPSQARYSLRMAHLCCALNPIKLIIHNHV